MLPLQSIRTYKNQGAGGLALQILNSLEPSVLRIWHSFFINTINFNTVVIFDYNGDYE